VLQRVKKINQRWLERSGFLLIELVIVLALVTVLLALTVPVARSWLSGREQRITFQLADNSYSINGKKYELMRSIQFGALSAVLGPPAQPKQIIVKPCSFADNAIKCYPNGTISSGTVYLKDTENYAMAALTVPVGSFPALREYMYKNKWIQVP
jgi:type II secretory pathway pseudopilin PulG